MPGMQPKDMPPCSRTPIRWRGRRRGPAPSAGTWGESEMEWVCLMAAGLLAGALLAAPAALVMRGRE